MGQHRFILFFYMQLKRALKRLPVLLAVNLLVCGAGGILLSRFLGESIREQAGQKYQIGIVGELSESYIGFQFYTLLKTMDDSRFMIDFSQMSESEAARALSRGGLTAYVRIPDGLVENLERGINDQVIEYVVSDGQTGLTNVLMENLVGVVSVLVSRSQSAVYGMQRILEEQGRGVDWWEATEQMCIRLVNIILNRTGLCELEITGISNELSTQGYYFCSIFIFFLLLMGINSSPLFTGRQRGMPGLMESRGVGAARQTAGEYLAFFCLTVVCLSGIFFLLSLVMGRGMLQLPEWQGMDTPPLAAFLARLLPAAAMLAAMQFFLYEAVTGIVSSILLQFVCCVSMCYLSGCFYPAGFFPEAVQRLGGLLPTGVAMRYADAGLTGTVPLPLVLGTVLYLCLFLGMSVLVRKYKIRRG